MRRDYTDYENALDMLNIPELSDRRNTLDKNMALKTCRNKKIYHMFPKRHEQRSQKRRRTEKYVVQPANTERFRKSTIPHMQRILHAHDQNILNWMKFSD